MYNADGSLRSSGLRRGPSGGGSSTFQFGDDRKDGQDFAAAKQPTKLDPQVMQAAGRRTHDGESDGAKPARAAAGRTLTNQSSFSFGGDDAGTDGTAEGGLPSARRRNANAQTSEEQVYNRSMSDAKRNALYTSNVFGGAAEADEPEANARPLSRQQSQSKRSEIAGHNIFSGAEEGTDPGSSHGDKSEHVSGSKMPPGGNAQIVFGDDYQLDPNKLSPAPKVNRPAAAQPRRPPGGHTSADFPF
ncbi:hypothetical protein WJX73_000860 [Symbiochloris irregularis]|uniref:Uncharacterized protein n=1 Tax=Symbiochloris irregularis TaxID=706552 RepID=A0AAW1NW43_9CHLO